MENKFVTKKVRACTEKEYTRMQAANERARAKREEKKGVCYEDVYNS